MAGAHLGDDVRLPAQLQRAGEEIGRVAVQADAQRAAFGLGLLRQRDALFQGVHLHVQELLLDADGDDVRVGVHHQADAAVHRHGARLVRAHAAQAGGEEDAADQRAAEVLLADGAQRLEGALDHALRADVLPRRGRVLREHRQVLVLQVVEDGPGRLHDVGGGHDDARRQPVGLEDRHGHAGLDGQRLVVLQVEQRIDDGVIRFPVARALADAAVDHQPLRPLGVLHVVFQHAQQRFLLPALAAQRRPALGLDRVEDFGFHGALLVMESFESSGVRYFRCAGHLCR